MFNKLIFPSSLLLMSSLLSLNACAPFWYPPESASAPKAAKNNSQTMETSKTSVGVLAGAAVGAGLGAIIGSASGNAGEGVAIGSVAGGAIGATVGYQLEDRDQEIAELREDVRRQNERISSQEKQYRELRKTLDDQFEENNTPSLKSDSYSYDTYRGSPKARTLDGRIPTSYPSERARLGQSGLSQAEGAGGSGITSKNVTTVARAPAMQMRTITGSGVSNAKSNNSEGIIGSSTSDQQIPDDFSMPTAVKPDLNTGKSIPTSNNMLPAENLPTKMEPMQVKAQEPISPSLKSLGENKQKLESPKTASLLDAKPAPKKAVQNRVEENQPADSLPAEVEKTTANTAALKPETNDANCKQASQEEERAKVSTSNADKLFYLRRALRLCPGNSKYHIEVASVYSKVGRVEDARFELRQALDLDPENEQALEQMQLLANE